MKKSTALMLFAALFVFAGSTKAEELSTETAPIKPIIPVVQSSTPAAETTVVEVKNEETASESEVKTEENTVEENKTEEVKTEEAKTETAPASEAKNAKKRAK